jgi:predicted nucleic acid-binding protein
VNANRVVLDTNVFFSLLLKRDGFQRRRSFFAAPFKYYCPRFLVVELFKHKERIARATQLSEDELLEFLHELLARIEFIEEGAIAIGTWMEARRLCQDVDPKDTPFVALALHLDCRIWTDDDELKRGLRRKNFDSFLEPKTGGK